MTRVCANPSCGKSLDAYRTTRKWCGDICKRQASQARSETGPSKPQRERVLDLLEQAASRGVHTFELRQAYYANPSQRIAELEAAGYVISHTRERLHGRAFGTRYRLVSEPGQIERAA